MYNNSVIKTPLSRSYSFYYRILNHKEEYSNSLSTQQYQEHVKKIGSFETVNYNFIQVEIDEIVKKNIEDRGIVCIDEFDKIARDVFF